MMAKTCLDRYRKIIKITRIMAFVCGADIVNPKYKMSPLTWTVVIAINAYFCCTIYTIYIGLAVEGDWKVILQTLSLAGSAVQGYSKLISFIHGRLVIITLNRTLDNIYWNYQTDGDFKNILRYRTDLTTKMLKTVLWIYIAGVTTIVAYPLIYSSLFDEKLFVMQFLLPGIDPSSDFGYWSHNIFHTFLIVLGAFGNFAGDMFIFTFIIHIPLLKDILRIKCEQFNLVALATREPKKRMPLLKTIVEHHKNYNRFAEQAEDVFYIIIFVQIFTSVVSICCTLFSIIIRSWPAAFAYLIYSTLALYAYCSLGHLVELSNDEVIDVIYGDCLWYELSVPEQKLILLMLRRAQSPTTLTIGQIMPLSMSTALQLTKAIYSFLMMLIRFLEMED